MEVNSLSDFKSGFATLVGRPNVGKSSLINAIMGEKISIISNKPQTTRHQIRCIYSAEGAQIVFVDTPGLLRRPRHKLGEFMVDEAVRSLEGVDVVCYVVEAGDREICEDDMAIVEILRKTPTPVFLVVNKIDLLQKKGSFWHAVALYQDLVKPKEVVPVSAVTGTNLDILIEKIISYLPQQPPLYPEDIVTDKDERFIAAETIREKIFLLTGEEVPYSVTVDVEEYKSPEEYPDRKAVYIRATIYVEREGQKAIIIGSGGKMLKEIGRLAREELEFKLGHKVYLELWVKVRPHWRKSERELRRLGYRA